MRTICMTPSNTLSATDASKFALKIVERPIVRDYLAETHGIPAMLVAQVPNDEDWWDTVDKASYCAMLSRRHKRLNYAELLGEKKLRWPDLSTFDGPRVLYFAFGGALRRPPMLVPKPKGGRSEIYEIKPDNARGRKDAVDKLVDVETSYATRGIAGIYQRGQAYPMLFSKRIELEEAQAKLFRYLANLYLRAIGAEVVSVHLSLNRPESGALLYKICVTLRGLDEAQRETVWVAANFAVRTLHRVAASTATAEIRAALEQCLLRAEPVEGPAFTPERLPWVIAGKDFRQTPYLQLRPEAIADEIRPQLAGIQAAMYSRLVGAPGERYLLCCDAPWLLANMIVPGRVQERAASKLLSTADLMKSIHARSMLGLAPTIRMTVGEVVRYYAPEYLVRLYEWVKENPGKVLIFVAVTVCVTALVIATAGAAAPVAGAGLAEAGVLGAGAVATGEAAAMTAPIMATTAGAELAGVSALPVVAAEGVAAGAGASAGGVAAGSGVVAGETGSAAMLQLMRQMATGLTQAELRAAAAQQVADNLLIKVLTSTAVRTTLVETATVAAKVAVPVGGALVVALSPSRAYAYSGAGGAVNAAAVDVNDSVDLGTGHVWAVRVPPVMNYPAPNPPQMYDEFDATPYVGGSAAPAELRRVRMLGSFRVV